MRQVPPQTRILLLGLPKSCAASVRQGLQAAGAHVDLACQDPCGQRFVPNKDYDVILVTLTGQRRMNLVDLAFCRQYGMRAGILAVVPVRDVGQVAHVLDGGADDCVTIPFEMEELLARLCALGRRIAGRVPQSTVLRTHDLEIDTVKRIVCRGGKTIPLTAREYALLQLLALHRGRVVSRSMIREQLYGMDEMTSNVIDVYIRYLRFKVDRGFELPLILTRWGQGYLLRDDADGEGVGAADGDTPRM